jgi:hypothetical protein
MVQPHPTPPRRVPTQAPAPGPPARATPDPPPLWTLLEPPRQQQVAQMVADLLRRAWRQRHATEGSDDEHTERD